MKRLAGAILCCWLLTTLAGLADEPAKPVTPDDEATKEVLLYWDREGEVLRSRTPVKHSVPHGTAVEYWPDGKTVKSETPYANGRVQGVAKTYFKSGKLETEVTSDAGKITQVKTYYENGKPQFSVPYRDGKRHGVEEYYSEAGVLMQTTTYAAGIKEGIMKEYFENGKLKRELSFHAGKEHGVEKIYTASHQVIWEKSWVKGTLDGEVKSYWPGKENQVQSLAVYEQGKQVGKTRFFDQHGNFVKEE